MSLNKKQPAGTQHLRRGVGVQEVVAAVRDLDRRGRALGQRTSRAEVCARATNRVAAEKSTPNRSLSAALTGRDGLHGVHQVGVIHEVDEELLRADAVVLRQPELRGTTQSPQQ